MRGVRIYQGMSVYLNEYGILSLKGLQQEQSSVWSL